MAERAEETNPETYNRVLQELLGQGVSRRVAEGRARRQAILEYRKEHPEETEEAPAKAADQTRPPEGGDGQAAPAAAPPAAAAPVAAAPGAGVAVVAPPAAPLTAPAPTGRIPTPKPGAPDKHRLLALVPPEGIQRVEREQGDRINTFPHLLIEEFLALVIVTAFLIVFSTFVNAPLRELANPNLTPNPSKAPWYFLGLQEMLRYFNPMIAGVTFPGIVITFLVVLPYVDRNPSNKPGDRKLAITIFTMFLMLWAILVIIGSFFRGPGYNFVFPWQDGVFFEL